MKENYFLLCLLLYLPDFSELLFDTSQSFGGLNSVSAPRRDSPRQVKIVSWFAWTVREGTDGVRWALARTAHLHFQLCLLVPRCFGFRLWVCHGMKYYQRDPPQYLTSLPICVPCFFWPLNTASCNCLGCFTRSPHFRSHYTQQRPRSSRSTTRGTEKQLYTHESEGNVLRK